jgi:predicted DNA binding CopG/RHH family protein
MKNKFKLTKEEKDIEKSLGDDEWDDAPDELKQELVYAAQNGIANRKREARVNIRLNQGDVDVIRQRANEEGLGYQTLMSSVLHKYATGRLVEKNVLDKIASEIASRVQRSQPRKKAAG